jgi:hypothetical protein
MFSLTAFFARRLKTDGASNPPRESDAKLQTGKNRTEITAADETWNGSILGQLQRRETRIRRPANILGLQVSSPNIEAEEQKQSLLFAKSKATRTNWCQISRT